jgi:hypothetical protein
MDPALRELLDKQELWELVHRACRAIDRADEEMLRSVYHPDALDEHGVYNGGVEGLIEHAKHRTHSLDPQVRKNPTRHLLHNVMFEIDGDMAWGESYCVVERVDDGKLWIEGVSRHIDRFERRNGEWRIAHRRVILEWGSDDFDVSRFPEGHRDRRDPVYSRTITTLERWAGTS